MYKKLLAVVMTLVVALTMSLATPEPAHASISCYGNTHYHRHWHPPVKHVNTGATYSPDRVVYRIWDKKVDRNRDGNYKHQKYLLASCGYPT